MRLGRGSRRLRGKQDGAKREGPYTVRHAIEDYQRDYEARSGKSAGRMEANISAHILPALGKT